MAAIPCMPAIDAELPLILHPSALKPDPLADAGPLPDELVWHAMFPEVPNFQMRYEQPEAEGTPAFIFFRTLPGGNDRKTFANFHVPSPGGLSWGSLACRILWPFAVLLIAYAIVWAEDKSLTHFFPPKEMNPSEVNRLKRTNTTRRRLRGPWPFQLSLGLEGFILGIFCASIWFAGLAGAEEPKRIPNTVVINVEDSRDMQFLNSWSFIKKQYGDIDYFNHLRQCATDANPWLLTVGEELLPLTDISSFLHPSVDAKKIPMMPLPSGVKTDFNIVHRSAGESDKEWEARLDKLYFHTYALVMEDLNCIPTDDINLDRPNLRLVNTPSKKRSTFGRLETLIKDRVYGKMGKYLSENAIEKLTNFMIEGSPKCSRRAAKKQVKRMIERQQQAYKKDRKSLAKSRSNLPLRVAKATLQQEL